MLLTPFTRFVKSHLNLKPAKRRGHVFGPIGTPAESLEVRQLLSATITKTTSNVVEINCSSASDTVTVTTANGRVYISATASDGNNSKNYPYDSNTQILFRGGSGNDKFNNQTSLKSFAYGQAGNDTLLGGSNSDTLFGGDNQDSINGNGGNDTVKGEGHNDTVYGGTGNDFVYGGGSDDKLYGQDGNDTLTGGSGTDSYSGGSGTDRIVEELGTTNDIELTNTALIGTYSNPISSVEEAVITGNANANNINARAFSGNVTLIGGAGNDTLYGGDGDDSITGDADNDELRGGAGVDTVDGGTGTDLLIEYAGSGGTLTLTNSSITGTVANPLSSIEKAELYGNDGNNTLDARNFSGSVTLIGGDGNDTLLGGSGNDRMEGGQGADLLNGGLGTNSADPGNSNTKRNLYINFDGATISNANLVAWSNNGDWGTDGVAELDANGDGVNVSTFLSGQTNREDVIRQAMEFVAEDFRRFGVDVIRLNANDRAVTGQQSTTVFVGPAVIDGHSSLLLGIASSVDLINNNDTDIAFVKEVAGSNTTEQAQHVANTLAHEAGHTFGLFHRDTSGTAEVMLNFSPGDLAWATNDYGFLDQSFEAVQGGVKRTDENGNVISQNSVTSLKENLA